MSANSNKKDLVDISLKRNWYGNVIFKLRIYLTKGTKPATYSQDGRRFGIQLRRAY